MAFNGRPDLELVLFGATSFVGQILCRYLAQEHREPNLRWAIAARSEDKLNRLKADIPELAGIETLIADSIDEASLRALCERTHVVISTVGPYALYGENLVRVCAETGTDYCDLTGEPHWIRRMIHRYETAAMASGARIVNSCGFDSIPSDLGVEFLQQQAVQHFGKPCVKVQTRVKAMKGGASGGTIASGINLVKEAANDPELQAELRDLYSLCAAGHSNPIKQRLVGTQYDEGFESWSAPFIMAAINTRIVLRSHSLGDYKDQPFQYDEATLTGDGSKGRQRAKRLARGSSLGQFVLAVSPLRWLATRFLPRPGEGPTPKQQLEGFFDLRLRGETEDGDSLMVKVTGDRDPGYGGTAKMLAQAAISLHRDVDRQEKPGGFWTPASVFNARLFERLEKYAGIQFEVLETSPKD